MSKKIRILKGKTKTKVKNAMLQYKSTKLKKLNVAGQDVATLAGLPASLPCLLRQPGDKQTLHWFDLMTKDQT